MKPLPAVRPPDLLRGLGSQLAILAAVVVLLHLLALLRPAPTDERSGDPPPVEPRPPQVRMLEVQAVQLPRQPAKPAEQADQPPAPAAPARKEPRPAAARRAEPEPSPVPAPAPRTKPAARPAARAPTPAQTQSPQPHQPDEQVAPASPKRPPAKAPARAAPRRMVAERSRMKGIGLEVFIPTNPHKLASHLRAAGGCLVVSELHGRYVEVQASFAIRGGRAVQTDGPICEGVPRIVRNRRLIAGLGDPIARTQQAMVARGRAPRRPLVLQVILSPQLEAEARAALRRRFGDLPRAELLARAGAAGYELSCTAAPDGRLLCR